MTPDDRQTLLLEQQVALLQRLVALMELAADDDERPVKIPGVVIPKGQRRVA